MKKYELESLKQIVENCIVCRECDLCPYYNKDGQHYCTFRKEGEISVRPNRAWMIQDKFLHHELLQRIVDTCDKCESCRECEFAVPSTDPLDDYPFCPFEGEEPQYWGMLYDITAEEDENGTT